MAFKEIYDEIDSHRQVQSNSVPELDKWRKLLSEKKWTDLDAYGPLTKDGLINAIRVESYSNWPSDPSAIAFILSNVCKNTMDIMDVLKSGASSSYWPAGNNHKKELYLSILYKTCILKKIPCDTHMLDMFFDLKIDTYNDTSFNSTYFNLMHKFNADGDNKVALLIASRLSDDPKNKSHIYALSSATKEQVPIYLDSIFKSKDKDGLMYAATENHIDVATLLNTLNDWGFNWRRRDFIEDLSECVIRINNPRVSETQLKHGVIKNIYSALEDVQDVDLSSQHYLLESVLKYIGLNSCTNIKQRLMDNRVYMRPDYTNKIVSSAANIQDWLELEFNYDKKLYNSNDQLGEDKVTELLKKSPWLSNAVVESKSKIADEKLIQYAGCMPHGDANWYIVMEELFSRVQKNKLNSRSTITKLKKYGMKTYAPVPRDFNDIDAFIYAISGDNSKTIRTAAEALDVRSTSETYCKMAFEHLKTKHGLSQEPKEEIPELSSILML